MSNLINRIFDTIAKEDVNVFDLRKKYKNDSDVAINNCLICLLITDKIKLNEDSLKYMVIK